MPASAPRPPSRRFAFTLNLFLPGLGQFYLGQPVLGAVFTGGFLSCFSGAIAIFLRAYQRYLDLSTTGDILTGDSLEQLARVFPTPWLIALLIIAVVIYLAAILSLGFSRPQKMCA
jgi:hypothetical protein